MVKGFYNYTLTIHLPTIILFVTTHVAKSLSIYIFKSHQYFIVSLWYFIIFFGLHRKSYQTTLIVKLDEFKVWLN
jgi:hypothetical protein